ncbi:32164_t:CDS:2 [Gigaspora margarita]|uniref:32164_t:CDS:1 n=1 Tax=Gigaspora margarita TaxID=4874 RepID=A0ABN7UGT4_GIGMA|nr:32164_t:CDS:2 [Gigaspora margarita]
MSLRITVLVIQRTELLVEIKRIQGVLITDNKRLKSRIPENAYLKSPIHRIEHALLNKPYCKLRNVQTALT